MGCAPRLRACSCAALQMAFGQVTLTLTAFCLYMSPPLGVHMHMFLSCTKCAIWIYPMHSTGQIPSNASGCYFLASAGFSHYMQLPSGTVQTAYNVPAVLGRANQEMSLCAGTMKHFTESAFQHSSASGKACCQHEDCVLFAVMSYPGLCSAPPQISLAQITAFLLP